MVTEDDYSLMKQSTAPVGMHSTTACSTASYITI